MKNRTLHTLLGALLLGVSAPAFAAPAMVTITFPAEGAKLDAMAQNKIAYEVVPGPKGNHVHLYVDGKEMAVLRQLKGTYTMDTLAAGNREICIKVVEKNHTPIGVEKCVKVTVQ